MTDKYAKGTDKELLRILRDSLQLKQDYRRDNQIQFYRPASETAAQIHYSEAHTIGMGGGNRSSKTESCMVEIIACATGVFPGGLEDEFRKKFKGPINVRICIESLTTVLHPIMLPKLKWWVWTGLKPAGGGRGHYGWVPRNCLKDGNWEKAWSEKLRILTMLCRDPDDPEKVLGESQIQFMSYDQDSSDYASGTFDIVMHDEPPPFQIWRENQARVLDVDGRIFLAMTWPDDPSIAVDWIYDEVYEIGQAGPLKDEGVDWFELQTLDNIHLDPQAVLRKTRQWSEDTKKVKLQGQPLRFSNRIHPLFTDTPSTWCFTCGRNCVPTERRDTADSNINVHAKICGCERESEDLADYLHVQEFEIGENWPVAFLLDPHPRKPHMFCWVAIDPSDDWWVVQEGELEGDAADLKAYTGEIEEAMGLDVRLRLMDPNMGASPSGARREITWQDEFHAADLMMDLADRSEVGRSRINQLLQPDPHTRRPRIVFHQRCKMAAVQFKRFAWDEHRRNLGKDPKQKPKEKYDDWPAMMRYLANYEPSFRTLYAGAPVLRRAGRRGAY